MKLTPLFLTALAVGFAQPPGGPPPRPPAFDELKAYLKLTDAQIQSIQQARRKTMESLRSVHEQIRTKEMNLRRNLEGETTDAAAGGKLMLEIQSLRKQAQQAMEQFRGEAVNLLTAEQKTRLKELEAAAKLMPEIRQAGALGLIAPPEAPAGAAPGPRRGRAPMPF